MASRTIPVRIGDVEVAVEAVVEAGTEATSGRASRAVGNVADAFDNAQDVILQVAKSTAAMIGRAGAAARPDRVDVEFGLKFSVSGGVILAGAAGEASLKVTLGYDVAARPPGPAAEDATVLAVPDGAAQGDGASAPDGPDGTSGSDGPDGTSGSAGGPPAGQT